MILFVKTIKLPSDHPHTFFYFLSEQEKKNDVLVCWAEAEC